LPTSGTAKVGGYDVVAESDKVRQIMGYMPDYFGVYNDLKVWEYLDFFAAAYKIPRAR
jgi:ABC-2 type transport system ATP-binding protein